MSYLYTTVSKRVLKRLCDTAQAYQFALKPKAKSRIMLVTAIRKGRESLAQTGVRTLSNRK